MRVAAVPVLVLALVASLVACKKDTAPEPTTGSGTGLAPVDPFDVKNAPPDAPPPPKPDAPPPPEPISTSTPCDQLARAECMRSDHCTLELVNNNVYRCRADQGKCEVGVHQQNPKECAAVAGCTYEPNGCYCPCVGHARTETVEEPPSGCACACGGGKPPACVEVKAGDAKPAAPKPGELKPAAPKPVESAQADRKSPPASAPASAPAPTSAPTAGRSSSLTWVRDERAAFADAKARGKGVMIDFAAEWCLPCKKLDETFNAPAIAAEINASFVTLRFDVTNATDADDAAQARYKAQSLPAVVFVDANGTELGRLKDDVPAATVLAAIRSAAKKMNKG